MTDYISREDALNFEMEIEADPEEIQAISKGMALYGEYIKSIPAADVVERKHWKWKDVWHDFFKSNVQMCSNCKGISAFETNYCPNCGAEMRGDSDD